MSKVWLDVSDIVASPEFRQTVTVKRHGNGCYEGGRFVQDEFSFEIDAVVSATDERSLEMIPEGDRTDITKTIHTLERIYLTEYNEANGKNQTSDTIIYNGDEYKVISLLEANDYGFCKAVISKIGGA